jgi:hypothetical protein
MAPMPDIAHKVRTLRRHTDNYPDSELRRNMDALRM